MILFSILDTPNNDKSCENINCSNEKYKYFKLTDKCPDDSSPVQLDQVEQKCCKVKHTCACNVCESKAKMVEWCKLAGTDFEAILVQKGEDVPGKCCDNHICRNLQFLYWIITKKYFQKFPWKLLEKSFVCRKFW